MAKTEPRRLPMAVEQPVDQRDCPARSFPRRREIPGDRVLPRRPANAEIFLVANDAIHLILPRPPETVVGSRLGYPPVNTPDPL